MRLNYESQGRLIDRVMHQTVVMAEKYLASLTPEQRAEVIQVGGPTHG